MSCNFLFLTKIENSFSSLSHTTTGCAYYKTYFSLYVWVEIKLSVCTEKFIGIWVAIGFKTFSYICVIHNLYEDYFCYLKDNIRFVLIIFLPFSPKYIFSKFLAKLTLNLIFQFWFLFHFLFNYFCFSHICLISSLINVLFFSYQNYFSLTRFNQMLSFAEILIYFWFSLALICLKVA